MWGFGNSVMASRILAVVKPKSSPIKKLKDEVSSVVRQMKVVNP
jgi:regulator of extracellular matrix RemA (YlzA/DUF370 family)